MPDLNLFQTSHIARSLVQESGDQLRQEWTYKKKETLKDVRDMATQYDQMVEERISKEIHQIFPNHGIFGEEIGESESEQEYNWYIDPIDGTKYFAADIPLFTVSLGLTKNGKPILGAIYNPISHQLYWGYVGGGAWMNYAQIKPAKDRPRKELVIYGDLSQFEKLPNEEADWTAKKHIQMTREVYRIRMFGCGSLGLSWLAAGGVDGFVDFTGRTKFFDVCAGIAIVNSAGGVTDEVNVGFDKKRIVAASNPKTLQIIKEILTK